jgi:V/A-type H+-transporting ATPase subunit F
MGNYRVITDAESAVGFRLAGIDALEASNPATTEHLLDEMISQGKPGMILVNHNLMDQLSDSYHRKLERLSLPLIIPIPIAGDWWKEKPREDYIFNLIRRAIGYQMKIGKT